MGFRVGGFRVWGSGLVWGLEFGVQGLLFRVFRVQGLGFSVWGWGSGFSVWGVRVQGLGFRVECLATFWEDSGIRDSVVRGAPVIRTTQTPKVGQILAQNA